MVFRSRNEGIVELGRRSIRFEVHIAEWQFHFVAERDEVLHSVVQDGERCAGVRFGQGGIVVDDFFYQLFRIKSLIRDTAKTVSVFPCFQRVFVSGNVYHFFIILLPLREENLGGKAFF